MRGFFVIGSGTGVGKTIVAAGLAHLFARKGYNVIACKPFATATSPFSKQFKSRDTSRLAKACGSKVPDRKLNPSFYPLAASPYMASRILKMRPPDIDAVLKSISELFSTHEVAIVEGIGGVMVPLTRRETLASFVKQLGLPAILVTTPFIGSLNHTLLTIQACRSFKIDIRGIVVDMMPREPSIVEREFPKFIEQLSDLNVISTIRRERRISLDRVADSLEAGMKGLSR